MTSVVLVAAAALFDPSGRVLLAQRPPGKSMAGLWEFPGGKIESGESPETALERELQEELNVMVSASEMTPLTFASHRYESFHLLMPLYECWTWRGEMRPREGQELAWVEPDALFDYSAPDADIPLFRVIVERFGKAAP